jgi:cysteine synthase A
MSRGPVKGVLATIGETPLVQLENLMPDIPAQVFAKLERFNPGGSVKDRSAVAMLSGMVASGRLDPRRSVVVESSSGNLGIGLAQACRYFGLRFVCVVDPKTTPQNVAILRAYGAEVEMVPEPDENHEFLAVRKRRVAELVATIPDAVWLNQYANPLNPLAHEQTMREIVEALDGRVDYLFCPVSTCGTLGGCAAYVRTHGLDTTLVAVDAAGSAIFGRPPHPRLLPGHGASIRPELFDAAAADDVVHVTDLDCVLACRRLTAREALLAGGSSGAAAAALAAYRDRIRPGSNAVLIFPDGGDRYLHTIYSDAWVRDHFGAEVLPC